MTINTNSTRYYSQNQEKYVANLLDGRISANSGAGKFSKSDISIPEAGLSIECKTCMTNKDSFSIKKDWIEKNRQEGFSMKLSNQCICFNFGPDSKNYFIINERLMKFLCEKLKEENNM